MNFFFKKKPIVLTCVTANSGAYAFAPPVNGAKVLPDWWRKLPRLKNDFDFDGDAVVNMRGCTGFVDMYRKSVVLPLWSDLAVEVGPVSSPVFRYQFADKHSLITEHAESQYKGFAPAQEYQHLKLHSPWNMVTSEPIDWLAIGMHYSQKDLLSYSVLPGILNFKHTDSTNVQIMVQRHPTEVKHLLIPHLEPLMAFIPLSDRPVKIQTHLVTREELFRMQSLGQSLKFQRRGMYLRNLIKTGSTQSTCPFLKDDV